ncbi:hypothetical protein MYX65_11350 [Acidobacteria bacterium AH-259-L09]|nr:hypothetical protein [Acidobacteria bacterium AH-259-L09]
MSKILQRAWFVLAALALMAVSIVWAFPITDKPFEKWTLDEAVQILNESPWARQETFTQVIGGIGSGVRGEKEIYNTFFVRLLSARPIREGYARVKQIQEDYDKLSQEEKRRFNTSLRPILKLDVEGWIVVAVSFRSNDPDLESRVRRFWQVQTTETMRSRAFLSTQSFPQVEVVAYYPPLEEGIGAKFVFPREIDGTAVVSVKDDKVTFELLEVPGADPQLRATFVVSDMVVKGQLIL